MEVRRSHDEAGEGWDNEISSSKESKEGKEGKDFLSFRPTMVHRG